MLIKLMPPPILSIPAGRIQPLKQVEPPAPPTPPAPGMETELGPARSMPGFDNSSENIHSEININGKVVARIYNSGAMEVAGAYAGYLQNLEGLGAGSGPRYADRMLASLKEALSEFGATATIVGGRSVNLYA